MDGKINILYNMDKWNKKKTILIVDDEATVRFILKEILSFEFEIVGTASNGKEAFKKYKTLKPDLVTMDVSMPEVDGLAGLKNILEFDSAAKVVMITTVDHAEHAQELIEEGALDYIVKPFKRERVLSGIRKILEQ